MKEKYGNCKIVVLGALLGTSFEVYTFSYRLYHGKKEQNL